MIAELRVVYERPNNALRDGEPAQIDADGERITVSHARFEAVIDPFARNAIIHCLESDRELATDLTRRTALSAILPLDGGLLLHSAGIVVDGRAIAFFGPSGAGKSTLSALVDAPILSDELISIRKTGERFVVEATGVWGELDARPPVEGSFPLAHLVALGRGEDVILDPLDPRAAARALVGATVVPPHPVLWRNAMAIVSELAHLPTSRLRWRPSRENARRVIRNLFPSQAFIT